MRALVVGAAFLAATAGCALDHGADAGVITLRDSAVDAPDGACIVAGYERCDIGCNRDWTYCRDIDPPHAFALKGCAC